MVEDATTPDLPVTNRSRWFWLRVATSTFFGLLTVALVVLWVRSRLRTDVFLVSVSREVFVLGYTDAVIFAGLEIGQFPQPTAISLTHPDLEKCRYYLDGQNTSGFGLKSFSGGGLVFLPIWFLILFGGATSALSYGGMPIQFSLRTMLTITTLVAVVLGLVVWAGR